LSRRSLLRGGAAVSGGLVVAGIATACGSSGTSSAGSSTTTAQPADNADQALKRLQAGNRRFVEGRLGHPRRDDVRRAELAEHQTPFAVILGCADSRVPPEILFDEGIGDLFPVRVAGNTAADDIVVGSIEYAAAVLGSVLVVVLGHEGCGAVKATIDLVTKGRRPPGHIPAVLEPIVPSVDAVKGQPADEVLDAATRENVRRTTALLQSSEPVLAGLVKSGKLGVVGAEYVLKTGAVQFIT
jgi:carbonic anhydrase